MLPSQLSPSESLAGRGILLLGSTGFLAKVMLGLLLERFGIRRVYCMIRETPSKSAQARLWDEVMSSEALISLRQKLGPSAEDVLKAKVEAVAGDLNRPQLGLSDKKIQELKGQVDLVINSAGLVNFNPPLDAAMTANAVGAKRVADVCVSLDAPLVHVSTCYVAGNRSGRIQEQAEVGGYFPKREQLRGIEFDWAREVADVERIIQSVKDSTDDAALEAKFRTDSLARLKEEGREPHQRTLRAAIANQRRRWVSEEQIRLGLERARYWGWTNIYTYSKALGEQAVAATSNLKWCIVRPAIVESALEYPFPGWNEGMNTSAPLAYLGLNGQVTFPGNNQLILDVVPVDAVASATLAAGADMLNGRTKAIFQVAAGDINPCTMARTVSLVGIYKRRKTKTKIDKGELDRLRGAIELRREPRTASRKTYERTSSPALRGLLKRARKALDQFEIEPTTTLGLMVQKAKQKADEYQEDLDRVIEAFDLFMPFIWENQYIFITRNTRELFARMKEQERALLPYPVEEMNWRDYWLDVHLPGLEKWVFPKLDEGPKRKSIPRDYRDLVELFDVRTREHSRQVAFRILEKQGVAEAFTYRDVRRAAMAGAKWLQDQGVQDGDRVLLLSEGRPEWGVSYFAIILSGAIAVPVDIELSLSEVEAIATSAGVQLGIASQEQLRRMEGTKLKLVGFSKVYESAHALDEAGFKLPKTKPEKTSSIIFTSGTTGKPKGVQLTHQNFAALTARLSVLFDLGRTDALLSVLPPHHTFEFSAGLLLPFSKGSSITYLEERTPELLSKAFDETPVTAMIGVPALIESLYRRIRNQTEKLPLPVRWILRGLSLGNQAFVTKTGWNIGPFLFRPIHARLGGRLRYLVSGAAPLDSDLFKEMLGLGFRIHEGYGLTEASPVLTVGWPGYSTPAGSVGWPLPGVEVKIKDPDHTGVGEVVARGPTIMPGYFDRPEETSRALQDGWLHTGDQGRMDEEGRLFILGRFRDTIIDTSGKNIYPDEIETLYADHPLLKELSVVGIPAEHGTGELIGCLAVPDYKTDSPDQVREQLKAHFRKVTSTLPFNRRIKVLHLWEGELPRTSTRKVKRSVVRGELMRLEQSARKLRSLREGKTIDPMHKRVTQVIAVIARKQVEEIELQARLVDDLGFDSLMQLELLSGLEAEGATVAADDLAQAGNVQDVLELVGRKGQAQIAEQERAPDSVRVLPSPVRSLTKGVLGLGQRLTYQQLLDVEVEGQGNIPANRNFIVASNHTSHLDMGLVKHALGKFGQGMRTLAAKDYFFNDPYRRTYFGNFTNLLPMDRHGSLKKSLRLASRALRDGEILLVFPEGTRARDGVMTEFKPAVGYLCLQEKTDILPMWLGGTYESMPVGRALPTSRKLRVRVGEPLEHRDMLKKTEGMSRSAAYRAVTDELEARVRALSEEASCKRS